MLSTDTTIAMLCSIALYEFSLNHKKDLPQIADKARKIRDAIDDMIASKWFEEEK